MAISNNYSIFLLGGGSELVKNTENTILNTYPNLNIVGSHHGYFNLTDTKVTDYINSCNPDILFVGMGDPRQVLWSEHVKSFVRAKLIITCGGMFKIISGDLERVSEFWRDSGFEWLFRLMREPSHTWKRYLIGNPKFLLRLFYYKFSNSRGL
jgi:N-acetylglucosaminyldiphosphoundecaprenol N-acetyl-beta-D-mannosaminyltransferase